MNTTIHIRDCEIVVIHSPNRVDRAEAIGEIRRLFPKSKVKPAVVPAWDPNRDSRSIRGCTLSHLRAVKEATAPVLVLENDAIPVKERVSELMNLVIRFPEDGGALLLGSEVLHSVATGDGFHEVFTPYHGTHGVLYNTPLLRESGFLQHAFEAAATLPLAENGACYEGVMAIALAEAKLRLLKLPKMYFGTIPSVSDRTGGLMPPRTTGDVTGLVPDEAFEPLLSMLRGQRVCVVVMPGNVGDGLIVDGTRSLFLRHGIEHVFSVIGQPLPPADLYAWVGGGSISGRWKHDDPFRAVAEAAHAVGRKFISLPQSIEEYRDHLDLADVLFLRESVSFDLAKDRHPHAVLVPDLALALPKMPLGKPVEKKGVFLRDDIESALPGEAKRDPRAVCASPLEYLNLAARFGEFETDCLHFGIAGLIAGRKVTFRANAYHKNRAMHETWLRDLGAEWRD